MIDTHIHAVKSRVPGSKNPATLLDGSPAAVAAVIKDQMSGSGVEVVLGMGHLGGADGDPLGIASTLKVAELLPELHAIGVADPTRTDTGQIQAVEQQIRNGRVKALKAYLGYLHHGPESPGYVPYYELAATYQLPFIFHTGDTYSTTAKVKFAHPLHVDEVAVDHRGVNFVMAHFGNPWVVDAAEFLYTNNNVWADLSGLLVGDDVYFDDANRRGVIRRVVERLRPWIQYTGHFDRFLFGTDWPLAPMRAYREFVEQLVPEEYHQSVFSENARELFQLR